MTPADCQEQAVIDWAVAARPLAGQPASGDLHFVKMVGPGVLLAVVDGIGHGEPATAAARAAVAVLDEHSREPMASLVRRCHESLTETRGVVMTTAFLDATAKTMTWLGVGNVEGRLFRNGAGSESLLLRGGLVGLQLPALSPSQLAIAAGDVLVLATDGLHHDFDNCISLKEAPARIADRILNRCFKGNDDALVLVARYLGPGP
jgi:negative regulator of sigma-B (phosphoserine phosphatase)